MAADNWTRCPRCIKKIQERIYTQEVAIENAYGNVSLEIFDEMRATVAKAHWELQSNAGDFREDYRISGADEGLVVIRYSGSCRKCKLSVEFKTEHPIPGV